ncbi:MAG: hypothetical protein LUO88_00610 [Methanoregulaceae archaeon]|nr:hypothetical protein [Methanoregulaceae archaeon]
MTPEQYLIIILLAALAFQWFLFYLMSLRLRQMEEEAGRSRTVQISDGEVEELMRNAEHVKQLKI